MIVGNYEDDKEYNIVATLIVKDGMNTAVADKYIPGKLVKKLESVMAEIGDYVSERENMNP